MNEHKERDASVALVRRHSFNWPKDADNGLSYSKMKHVTNLRHPRMVVNGERKNYKWCKTRTGWHCACKDLRDS